MSATSASSDPPPLPSTTTTTTTTPTPTPAPAPPVRKVPVPCWTHEETLALITAYRQRWTALRRGYLRSADWDAVSAAVPTKSSDQCRHKMEKLRQRYRAEKQRSLASAFPSAKFFSGWIFFKVLNFLDDGASSVKKTTNDAVTAAAAAAAVPASKDGSRSDSGEGFLLTALGDRKFTLDLKNFENPSLSGYRRNIPFPVGEEENVESRLKKKRPRVEIDHDDGASERFSLVHKGFIRSEKVNGMLVGNPGRNLIIDLDIDGGGLNFSGGGVSGKLHSSKITMPKIVDFDKYRNDQGGEGTIDPIVEMAASIKQLGDGFMKMEKMRMEMAVEFEKARMEVELKRNEMIMESQQRIVDAFMKVAKAKRAQKEVCVLKLD